MQKVDLFLRKSRNNDEFGRTIRGRIRSDKEVKSIVAKWRSCEHLFVKVRAPIYIGAFHSTDCMTIPARYECVRCGLTNRLIEIEKVLNSHEVRRHRAMLWAEKEITDETTEWRHQKPKVSGKNLLSEEPIGAAHPGVLFDVAGELCLAQGIKTTKQNVFKVMKELYSMETVAEQLKISTIVHASALIERYKNKHELYVNKK